MAAGLMAVMRDHHPRSSSRTSIPRVVGRSMAGPLDVQPLLFFLESARSLMSATKNNQPDLHRHYTATDLGGCV